MKGTGVVRTLVLFFSVVAVGCQDNRPVLPTAASLFLPTIQGVWSGPLTLMGTSGGECVGAVVPSFLPSNDVGTVSLAQTGTVLHATLTMEHTGLACKYDGTNTGGNLAMNATSCDRTGLIVQCVGTARELQLVGSSFNATWTGDQMTGVTTSTYNVLTNDDKIGVGSIIATHSFTATRR
jgi:hypothetical protein